MLIRILNIEPKIYLDDYPFIVKKYLIEYEVSTISDSGKVISTTGSKTIGSSDIMSLNNVKDILSIEAKHTMDDYLRLRQYVVDYVGIEFRIE